MDVDGKEERISFNVLIYAVDDQGICHLFENSMLNIEETTDVSKSIVHLSNQIDHSLQLTNEDFIQNSSKFFSTQPFAIVDLSENDFSSLRLFNNDHSTPVLTPPLQFSGHIASQYLNVTVINSMEKIPSMKKKRKRKFRSRFDRLSVLKKRLKSYMKKKKKYKEQCRSDVQPVDHQLESSITEPPTMMDFQLVPDLSKRKYIYKDITLSNQNQMNWQIFQCTQQPSTIPVLDSADDRSSHPFICANKNSISLPDRRIGLSRHHSIKQLHKMINDL